MANDSLNLFELPPVPDYSIEAKLANDGKKAIAGVDEVGRGPLAGPVVCAAVILDPQNIPQGLNDSKKLSEMQRDKIFHEILTSAEIAWCSLPTPIIDAINIRQATLEAMTRSVQSLPRNADAVLVDGRDVPERLLHVGKAFVKGDSRSVSIAAASIVAKVIRDKMMIEAHRSYPHYGFDQHKGYGTKKHLEAINAHGACKLHRKSFAPIKQLEAETNA